MHGSSCLFSKFMIHFLNGENAENLDISTEDNTDNIFSNIDSLSSNWGGTCSLVNLFNNLKTNFNEQISILNYIFTDTSTTTNNITHEKLKNSYERTNGLLDAIFTTSPITVTLPSNSQKTIPNFENEFSDPSNNSQIGGQLYSEFNYNFLPFYNNMINIKTNLLTLLNDKSFTEIFTYAYSNFSNFDNTISTAANVMIPNFLDDKDYILDILQFMFLFISCCYLVIFVFIFVVYIIYLCKGYETLYYVLFILLNVMLIFAIWEIINAGLFGGVRLICHEGPRALNFIFTGNYIINGNTNSYPAKFGNNDQKQIQLFDICLNGDGDLSELFFSDNDITTLKNLKDTVDIYYNNMSNIFNYSNVLTNSYNNLQNYAYLNALIKLENMQENLDLATEGFGDDEIKIILYNIKDKLSSCGFSNEYYVIKKSDCPSTSTILETIIQNDQTNDHCYIIQNLSDIKEVSYESSSCEDITNINTYIKNAISFIKAINNLLNERVENIKKL